MTTSVGRCRTCTGYYRLVDGLLTEHPPLSTPTTTTHSYDPGRLGENDFDCLGSGQPPVDEQVHWSRIGVSPHEVAGGLPTLGKGHR